MKVTISQCQATSDLDANLTQMRLVCEKAKSEGADLVAFPEMAYFMGSSLDNRRTADRFSELVGKFGGWAKELNLYLLPGSLRSPSKGGKSYNHAVVLGPDGNLLAEYRKIFLFKANLPERRYDESELYDAGAELCVFTVKGVKVGLAICFDLRFPELFRALKARGAEIVIVPSAFTVPTGKAHWEVLLRSRAIENQFFVLAPSLVGLAGDGTEKYGHSLGVDPWGTILFDSGDKSESQTISIDLAKIQEARRVIDPSASLRKDLFPEG